jgi:hypothetical protein
MAAVECVSILQTAEKELAMKHEWYDSRDLNSRMRKHIIYYWAVDFICAVALALLLVAPILWDMYK